MVGHRVLRRSPEEARGGRRLNAEIVGVGTELLLGPIANTNAQEISKRLAGIGIGVLFHSVVGDNPERMEEVISRAAGRADVVIITGGLGPTSDDITREAVVEVTGHKLQRSEQLEKTIAALFEKAGREMPEANLKQADAPEGSTPIEPVGTAPGFFLEHEGSLIVALPGVPWEMRSMLETDVLPELQRRAGGGVIASREVLIMGLGESRTQEMVSDIVEAQTNPTIAYLASAGQLRLRLTAKAATETAALALIRPVEDQLRERLGADAVEGNHNRIAEALGELLRSRELTVAVAESLTGGLMGSELSLCGGSSDFYLGGVVTYATASKRDVLGVDESILKGPGAVSPESAAAMAEKAAQLFGAEIGLSATGVAGPSEQEGKPVGMVFVGAWFEGRSEVRRIKAHGDRAHIRAWSAAAAFDLGRRLILTD